MGSDAAVSRRLEQEAKESSGVTSALLLAYVERVSGREAVAEILRRCGLEGCEAELRDENTWFSWETKIALFETTAEVLGKPHFLSELGAYAMEVNVAGGLKVALRTLGSPQFVLRNIVRANARFVRSHVLELLELDEGHARLRFSEIRDASSPGRTPRCHHLDCEYTAGLLAVIPALFGLPPASVGHRTCSANGAEACIFELKWEERPVTRRQVASSAAAVAAGAAASLVLFPPALAVVGTGAAVRAAMLLAERTRWSRERWRHLERQLEESEEVAQRLFASLQDLVSDLRLEEVVAKVTRNAQAAMGGRDFLLLVREGDGLICQSSSGLPAEAIATVEAWANGSSRVLEGALLIDDVAAVPSLRELAAQPNPTCTLACAPLTASGEPFGLMVALGGQQRAFLPREVDVLESYAAQVSIALYNARLYQSQRSLAARDPLTGLLNHRSFHEALDAELERCAAEEVSASVVLIDLDNFKQVNDEDGHAAGDGVLRAVARALSDVCRREDLAFRVGGDEFALLLEETTADEAEMVARRACRAIDAIDPRMGASAGVAEAGPTMMTADPVGPPYGDPGGHRLPAGDPRAWSDSAAGAPPEKDALIAQADRRLYAAKAQAGRRTRERPAAGYRPESPAASWLSGSVLGQLPR